MQSQPSHPGQVAARPGIDWYGAYDFSYGRCFIWSGGKCNGENTIRFLQELTTWLGPLDKPVFIIWDGAPCHRAKPVQAAAANMDVSLAPLPDYSPDLNPIEGLWKWMREDVTYNYCYDSVCELFDACKRFIERINCDPLNVIKRLWPLMELNPDHEKLLVSK